MRNLWMVVLLCMGCAYANPMNVARLMTLNPLTVDPSDLALTVALPEWAGVQAGGVELHIFGQQSLDSEQVTEIFVLQQRATPSGIMFRVGAEDLQRMRATQTMFREWKTADPQAASGGISVMAKPCYLHQVRNGDEIEGTMSVSMMLKQNGPVLPLIRRMPLRHIAKELDDSNFGLCEHSN